MTMHKMLATAATPMPPMEDAVGPSFSPLYQQIKVLLVRSLQAGEWLVVHGATRVDCL